MNRIDLLSAEEVEGYIRFAKHYEESRATYDWDAVPTPPNIAPTFSYRRDTASSTTPDPHAVSEKEAFSYYYGLHSKPTLLYRTGKEKWSPPTDSALYRYFKELREVFTHPIVKVWNHDLGWKVVDVMDAHMIRFTTIDVVRFKKARDDGLSEYEEDGKGGKVKKQLVSPVTIWIGVFPDSTSATAAHNAAQDVLALLKDYQITDIDIEFRESYYTREVGPQLLEPADDLDPLVDDISPLTPALGLRISTIARPEAQGTMALYLAEGGGSDRLLGLSCRHVLIGSKEANLDYVFHPSRPPKAVLLLGRTGFTNLVDSIKSRIGGHGIEVEYQRRQIERLKEREKGTNAVDVEEAKAHRIEAQGLVDDAEKAMVALVGFLDRVKKDWNKLDKRIIGHILRSPPITLGVGEHRFTEDWAIFELDRTKLGHGFQGNKMDLGTKLGPMEFTLKCFPHGDANWKFEYPILDRGLPLIGTITDDLMHNPDMWDSDGEPRMLVIKNGSATGTTIGRANGAFSIVREYFTDMSINRTSMEWGIMNYDSNSEVFSEPGDSGSAIADIRGRIGGMLTGSSGKRKSFGDMTYATPFWWLLERIRANGFPNAHPDVVTQGSRQH